MGCATTAIWNGHERCWPEAEVIAEPVKGQSDPLVLVRRRSSGLVTPSGDELCLFPSMPVISLFTGAGGMDIGLEMAGMMTVVQHEWFHAACETLIANRPAYFRHAALIQGDIRLTPTSMLLREAGLRVGEARLVVGGPPCQGFSMAGNRDPGDVRNSLVFEFLRVVREAQPMGFIFENVSGFQTLDGGRFHREFLSAAHDAYYELVYGLIDCVEYGVPQHRVRFICVGTRRDLVEIEGILGALPEPTHFGKKTLRTLYDLDQAPLLTCNSRREITRAPGIRYFPDRPVLRAPCPTRGSSGERSPGFIKFYSKLQTDEPDRIVTAPIHAV